jgi:nucleotide-binding universal stress UspA family protein
MFRNILVPLDGSFTAEKILPWAEMYAKAFDSTLHLVRTIEAPGLTKESDHNRGKERNDALRYLESVAAGLGKNGLKSEIYVREGRPAQAIVETSRQSRSEVIMLTTRGKTSVRRGLFGGTAEKILRLAPRSLFITHGAEAPKEVKTILVPVDGSELSEAVIPSAIKLARHHKSRLLFLYVQPIRSFEDKRPYLENLCKSVEWEGVQAQYRVANGDSAVKIADVARQKKVGLIAMNSHGRGGFVRFILGSVAEEVLHSVDAPIFMTCGPKPVAVSTARRAAADAKA